MTEFCPCMNVIREVGNKEKAEDVASIREENAKLALHLGN